VDRSRKIVIATRKSPLALWQANTVKSLLEKHGLDVELNTVTTSGDKMQRGALAEVSLDDPNIPAHLKTGKGLFVKEVQEEILARRADLAVHSMKDLPVEATDGLRVAAVLPRANPSDVMIFSPRLLEVFQSRAKISGAPDLQISEVLKSLADFDWANAAPVGTTSARRQFFLRKTIAPAKLPLVVLRGNVDTRLSRVWNNEFSFIMLARAGIDRLGLYSPERMLTLPPEICTPAPAQGVVAIECRSSDVELRAILSKINHSRTSLAAACERAALWLTGGNCHTALAAHFDGQTLTAWAAAGEKNSNLTLQFLQAESKEFTSFADSQDHHDVFRHILASPAAARLHSELLARGFDQLMNLRSPHAGNAGSPSC
jgi:hydroxymethylbilane synthase